MPDDLEERVRGAELALASLKNVETVAAKLQSTSDDVAKRISAIEVEWRAIKIVGGLLGLAGLLSLGTFIYVAAKVSALQTQLSGFGEVVDRASARISTETTAAVGTVASAVKEQAAEAGLMPRGAVVFWFKPEGNTIPKGWQPCDSALNTYIPQFATRLEDVAAVGNFHIESSSTRGQDNISIYKVMCLQKR